jgi:hypothetical protein
MERLSEGYAMKPRRTRKSLAGIKLPNNGPTDAEFLDKLRSKLKPVVHPWRVFNKKGINENNHRT